MNRWRKKLSCAAGLALLLTLCAVCALAADVFKFDSKSIDLFEGETAQIPLIREGSPEGEGTLTYKAVNPKAVSVSEDGTITALAKGQSAVKATLKTEKRTWTAEITVRVLRAVTKVTLNTTRLRIYQPTDEAVAGLLRQETPHDVIVIAAGKSFELRSTCTPSDASVKKVTYASTDQGVLKTGTDSAKALQAGECDLTVTSVQNPEIFETYHVLVIQPVTKLTISSAEGKTLDVGDTLQLETSVEPAGASIRAVEWSSRNPKIATVDENGVARGVAKGNTIIEAKATDGSGKSDTFGVTVAQKVTSISMKESGLNLATNQQAYLHATAWPDSANDKGILWSSSDPGIATVTSAGQVKGIRRGECEIIATSRSNPNISCAVTVRVIQRVTKITFPGGGVSLPIQTTEQLVWQVEPSDASIQEVTFASSNPKVATVSADGVVTGIARGSATITATATDGSGKKGQVRVTVTQPVEGVKIRYEVYHVQLGKTLNVMAQISPQNANNQNVHFTIEDGYIASVTDAKNIGRVTGWHEGMTTITGVTEDGGYSDTAEIRVADFNRAVVVDDLYLEGDQIRITLRNRGDFTVDQVYFTVETYDRNGNPIVCNVDGESNAFIGSCLMEIGPDGRSVFEAFDFGDYAQPTRTIVEVTVKITGWRDMEGYTRSIPEEEYPSQTYRRFLPASPQDII